MTAASQDIPKVAKEAVSSLPADSRSQASRFAASHRRLTAFATSVFSFTDFLHNVCNRCIFPPCANRSNLQREPLSNRSSKPLTCVLQRCELNFAKFGRPYSVNILSNLSQQILQNLTILFSQNLASLYLIEIKQVISQNTCVQTVECTFRRTEATK